MPKPHGGISVHSLTCATVSTAGIVNASVWIFQPRWIFRWYSPSWHLINCMRHTTWKLVIWVQSSQRTLRDNEWFQATEFWGGLLCKSRETGTTLIMATSLSGCPHRVEWMSTLTLSGWSGTPPTCHPLHGIGSSLPVVNVVTDVNSLPHDSLPSSPSLCHFHFSPFPLFGSYFLYM